MHKIHLGLAMLCSLIGSALGANPVLAEPKLMEGGEDAPSPWLRFSGDQGLLTELPAPSAKDLVARITGLQAQLRRHKDGLLEAVSESELGATDALITAIMPGGLVYATIKKHRHGQAKSKLESVATDLAALNRDLLVFRAAAGDDGRVLR